MSLTGNSHPVVTRDSRAPPHHTLAAFLNLYVIRKCQELRQKNLSFKHLAIKRKFILRELYSNFLQKDLKLKTRSHL